MDTSRTFPARPASVREARALAHDLCRRTGAEDVEHRVTLLVSELVTNAVVHAGTPVRLDMSIEFGVVTVSVTDGDPRPPAAKGQRGESGGFGLWLLDREADGWGILPRGRGKTVWFSLPCRPSLQSARRPRRRLQTAGVGGASAATR